MYEAGERIDNKWNVWEFVENYDKEEGYTAFWQVIRVMDTEKAAKDFVKMKKRIKKS